MTPTPNPPSSVLPVASAWAGLACVCEVDGDALRVRAHAGVPESRPVAPGDDLLGALRAAGAAEASLDALNAAITGERPDSAGVYLPGVGPLRVMVAPLPDGRVSVGVAPDAESPGVSGRVAPLEWLRAAFRNSRQAVWAGQVVDGRLRPLFVSAGMNHLTEPDGEGADLLSAWMAIIHPDDRERVMRRLDAAGGLKDASVVEYRIVRPDGDVRWVRSTVAPLEGHAGSFFGIITDITGERASRQELERILSAVREVLVEFAWTASGEWFVRFASPSTAAVLGIDSTEPADVARVLQQRVHTEDRLGLERALRRLRAGTSSERVSLRVTTQQMVVRRLEGTLVAGKDEMDRPRVLGVLSDHTERRALEARLRRIAEVIENVVFEVEVQPSGEWWLPYLSPSAARLMGMPVPDDPQRAAEVILNAIHVDDRGRLGHAARAAMRDHLPASARYRLVRADGESRRVRTTLVRFEGENGAPRLAGVTTDVTDQWEAEQRASRVVEAVNAIIAEGRLLPDGRWELTHADPSLERLLARPLSADPVHRGGEWFRTFHPDDRGLAVRSVQDVVINGRPVSVALRILRGAGEVRWVRMLVAPTSRPEDPTRFAAVITDITDQRTADERLQRVLDGLNEVIIEGEVDVHDTWHATFVSAAADRLLGSSLGAEQRERGLALERAVHPDDRDSLMRTLMRVARRGGPEKVTLRVVRADGAVRWIRGMLTRRDQPPAGAAVAGVLTDVTELVETGWALVRAERGLTRQVVDATPIAYEAEQRSDGVWVMTHISESGAELLGAPLPEEPLARINAWMARMRTEDVALLGRTAMLAMENGIPQTVLYRIATARGERWVQATIMRLGPGRMAGSIFDVSDVLDADEALRSAQEGLSRVIDGLGQAVFELRVSQRGEPFLEYANSVLWRLLGVGDHPPSEPTRALMDAVHADDRGMMSAALIDALEGIPLDLEVRAMLPGGKVRRLNISGRPRVQADGSVLVAGTLGDVTETRAARELVTERPAAPHDADDDGPRLTRRQQDVLELLATGASTEEIAVTLSITRITVANHVAAILRRLGARSRLEAVHLARRAGLLDPE